MISINVQNDTLGFTGNTVAEYGVGCAEIDDVSVIIKNAKPAWINSLVKKDNPKIKKSRRRQKKSLYR